MTPDASDPMERSNSAARATVLLSQGINVVRALEARGIDAAPLLRQAGCAPALFHVPETRVPNRVVQRVFELAKQATGDPCFGLDVGEQVRGVALHAVGYAWLASATLFDAMSRLARYTRVLTDLWRAPQPSLLCRRDDLERRLVTTNPGIALASDRLVADYLARLDRDDAAARVKRELLGYFPAGKPTQAAVARAIGMSTRSLHRRLAAAGTSFERLLDETRHELAAEYVRRADYAVGEVAYLLGFAETSSFNRAFRRWTGKSPSEFRRADPIPAPTD